MYVDTSHLQRNGKTYTRHLLRKSYRENGKVKHSTVANISHCSDEEVEALRLALRHKGDLGSLGPVTEAVFLEQGPSVGALTTVYQIAKRLGIVDALGTDRQGKLALWQVFARVCDQGSRLSSVRYAKGQAVAEVLGLNNFNEDDLYTNLDWLSEKQEHIENALFAEKEREDLFLYDVTSSYFEGTHNELAAFGYNRDGKRGKMQLIAGLLCDADGDPVAVELFKGNTSDQATVESQIKKITERFHVSNITLVGDRGMIKAKQMNALGSLNLHYITAITKPQIEALLKKGVFQMDLFDSTVAEITTNEGLRYVLRRNPFRAQEIERTRESKKATLAVRLEKENKYLLEHPKATVEAAKKRLSGWATRLRINKWLTITADNRTLKFSVSHEALKEESKFDGCYVIQTDLPEERASKDIVHDRYKDLALVEQAFRTSKTSFLDIRPIFLIKERRTRGHALVTMLAYKIVRELYKLWYSFDITVQEALNQLSSLCLTTVRINKTIAYHKVPTPRPFLKELLVKAKINVPTTIQPMVSKVSTNKKLQEQRVK